MQKQSAQQKALAELVEKFRLLLEGNSEVTMADIEELTRAIYEAAARR